MFVAVYRASAKYCCNSINVPPLQAKGNEDFNSPPFFKGNDFLPAKGFF